MLTEHALNAMTMNRPDVMREQRKHILDLLDSARGEVVMDHALRDARWRKSSRSGAGNENCVEVRSTNLGVGVRDSKNQAGPAFSFDAGAWAAFLKDARAGRFDPQG